MGDDEGRAKESSEEGSDGDWTRRTALKTLGAATGTTGGLGLPTGKVGQAAASNTGFESMDTTQESGEERDQQAKLAADDGDSSDHFGRSVSVSDDGTTAVVGASEDEDPNGNDAGSAYVFERAGGEWTQQAKLAADDGDSIDRFGWSMSVSDDGTTAIIGAVTDVDANGRGGSAYVFGRAGEEWTQQAKLTANDGGINRFGRSVSVSGDGTTAIIGAYRDEDSNGESAGSAYVFGRAGGEWAQRAKLAADDGDSEDSFGWSVSVSGDGTTAIIGAINDEDPNGEEAGSAYVFGRAGGEWAQRAKLAANDGDRGDTFGASVSVSGDGTTAIIGAINDEDPNGGDAGSGYVFERAGGEWRQQAKFGADDGDSFDGFGASVSVSGDGTTAIIGAPGDEDPNGESAGSAYVFGRAGGEWAQRAKLAAADGDSEDSFGWSVSASGNGTTAVVGADDDEDPNGEEAGSAYVFEGFQSGESGGETTNQPEEDDSGGTADQNEAGDSGGLSLPGLGIGGGLAGLGGGLYWLVRRRKSEDDNKD